MTDIELVIKIPKRDYDLACNYPDMLIATYAHYIKDGILYEERSQDRIKEIIEELESRKDYGVEYAQAMEDVIAILTAKLNADTGERE